MSPSGVRSGPNFRRDGTPLGLTLSLDVGYRLSPRGEVFLGRR